jgi:hypothetical protein
MKYLILNPQDSKSFKLDRLLDFILANIFELDFKNSVTINFAIPLFL